MVTLPWLSSRKLSLSTTRELEAKVMTPLRMVTLVESAANLLRISPSFTTVRESSSIVWLSWL